MKRLTDLFRSLRFSFGSSSSAKRRPRPLTLALEALEDRTVPATVGSPTFYSVDTAANELVEIDSATGQVTVIGALGFDALDVDLTSVGNRIFALNSDFNQRVDLHEINPLTGASISSVQVHTASGNILSAEGLTQVNGQLKIGFRDVATAANQFTSNALGNLSTTGLITTFQTGSSTFDFDGLGVDNSDGQVFGLDTRSIGVDLFRITESPLSISNFHTIPAARGIGLNDLAVTDNTVFGIDNGNALLYIFDLATNSELSIVPLDGPGQYTNIALKQNQPPSITSSDTVDVAENQTAVIDVQSTDPDGETENGGGLTYSLTGGADKSLFAINADTGVLTFKSAPNFESPADNGGNNVYNVQVTVTDAGGLTDVQDMAVTVTDVNEAPSAANFSKTGAEDSDVSFSKADFEAAFSDPDNGASLSAIRIDALSSNGTLKLNGVAVTAGQVINAADLANLVFDPNLNFNGETTFTYSVRDNANAFSQSAATVTLDFLSAAEQAVLIEGKIEALRAAGLINDGQAESLSFMLKDNNGDAGKVQAFLNEVNAFINGGILTEEQAHDLLVCGNLLLITLENK